MQLVCRRPGWRDNVKLAAAARETDPAYRQKRNTAAAINGRQAVKSADRAKAGRTRSLAALGWLPVHRLDEYRRLRRDFGAARARRIILADLSARDRRAGDEWQQDVVAASAELRDRCLRLLAKGAPTA